MCGHDETTSTAGSFPEFGLIFILNKNMAQIHNIIELANYPLEKEVGVTIAS